MSPSSSRFERPHSAATIDKVTHSSQLALASSKAGARCGRIDSPAQAAHQTRVVRKTRGDNLLGRQIIAPKTAHVQVQRARSHGMDVERRAQTVGDPRCSAGGEVDTRASFREPSGADLARGEPRAPASTADHLRVDERRTDPRRSRVRGAKGPCARTACGALSRRDPGDPRGAGDLWGATTTSRGQPDWPFDDWPLRWNVDDSGRATAPRGRGRVRNPRSGE